MVLRCTESVEFADDPGDRTSLDDIPIEHSNDPGGSLLVDDIPLARLRMATTARGFGFRNGHGRVPKAVVPDGIPRDDGAILPSEDILPQIFNVLLVLNGDDARHQFPPRTSRVNSLGEADDADVIVMDEFLENRHRDDGLTSQAAEAEEVQDLELALLGRFNDSVQAVPFAFRSRFSVIRELQSRIHVIPVLLCPLPTQPLLIGDSLFPLQRRTVTAVRCGDPD